MASNVGWTSVGELEMTRRISAVAVCCSSDSLSSVLRASSSWKRRTFSIAITACAANVSRSLICLSVKGRTSSRRTIMAPSGTPSRMSGVTRAARCP
jgi:hypothetical protein